MTVLSFLYRFGFVILAVMAVIVMRRPLALLIGAIALAVLITFVYNSWRSARAQRRFRVAYGPKRKDLLLVYSNSPNWQTYVETAWLPRWGERAVLLNWSERSRWQPGAPEVQLFRSLAGDREFNPLAVVVPPSGKPAVIRFWLAFRDYKHGKERLLRAAEAELEDHLSSVSRTAS